MDEVVEALEKYQGLVPLVYDIETMSLDEARPEDMQTAVYLKREADKVIAHHKYKRCLAMAWWCETNVYNIRRKPLCDMDDHEGWQHDDEFWQRWHKRWLELAEKLKEAK